MEGLQVMKKRLKVWLVIFFSLFQSRGIRNPTYILSGIQKVITKYMNLNLTALYTVEEIILALKNMTPTKASGDDGFHTLFFQSC